jgi:hypothetical protein
LLKKKKKLSKMPTHFINRKKTEAQVTEPGVCWWGGSSGRASAPNKQASKKQEPGVQNVNYSQ